MIHLLSATWLLLLASGMIVSSHSSNPAVLKPGVMTGQRVCAGICISLACLLIAERWW